MLKAMLTGGNGVQEMVCQHEVDQGLGVGVESEVLVVVAAETLSQSSRVVKHRGHAVEPETVEAVNLNPHRKVRQQEP